MLKILGVGHYLPEGQISSELMSELHPACQSSDMGGVAWGQFDEGLKDIHTRRTVLELGYIKQTLNQYPTKAIFNATESTTDLAVKACLSAISRAGINKEQVGLILGASSTPRQTTPAESHRVGGKLGLKVPAFDVACGAADLALHLKVLGSWKKDRVPEYVLCFTSSSITERVDYSRLEGRLMGDGACALVVSRSALSEGLGIKRVVVTHNNSESLAFLIALYGHLKIDPSVIAPWASTVLKAHLNKIEGGLNQDAILYDGGLFPGLLAKVAKEVPEWRGAAIRSHISDTGYCLGAQGWIGLSEEFSRLKESSKMIALLSAGSGLSSALVQMETIQ